MGELGDWLRETREAQELSLADVESVTRIRQKYLAALEAGNWEALPSEVVGRGFLRNYAQFLGLDPEEAIALRQQSIDSATTADLEVALPEPRPVDYRPIEVDLFEEGLLGVIHRFWPVAAVVLTVVILAGGGWWLYSHGYDSNPVAQIPVISRSPTNTPTSSPTPLLARTTPTPTAMPVSTATPTSPPTPTATPTSTQEPSPTPGAVPTAVEVTLQISERAWLRVKVDGATVMQGILEQGDERVFTGTESVDVRSGNAGGVRVILNGKDLGLMGEPGQVVELVYALQDGQLLIGEPTPPPPATETGTLTTTVETTGTVPITETGTITGTEGG